MRLDVIVNAPDVAHSVDGVPADAFGAAAGAAFAFVFAAWGLDQLVLGVASLVVLLRYRSLVTAAFLALLIANPQFRIDRVLDVGRTLT